MSTILGIDPGKTGALVIARHLAGKKSTLLAWLDMPICSRSGRVDGAKIAQWLDEHWEVDLTAVIESVGVMNGSEGRVSMFNFGCSFGVVLGVLGALGIKTQLVTPSVWKSVMGLNSDKNTSLSMAKSRFPSHAEIFSRKKDDGRAEAALLSVFGGDRFK